MEDRYSYQKVYHGYEDNVMYHVGGRCRKYALRFERGVARFFKIKEHFSEPNRWGEHYNTYEYTRTYKPTYMGIIYFDKVKERVGVSYMTTTFGFQHRRRQRLWKVTLHSRR